MSIATVPRYLSEAEYLAIERAAPTRSEYYRGEMFAMAGASESHVLISMNLARLLWNPARDRSCRVYGNDMRVGVSESGLYTYPDLSIACGSRQFLDSRRDTLLNPIVLVEVLSPSTEDYDRKAKFELYEALESLREYVLVTQNRMRVECYSRNESGSEWQVVVAEGPDAALTIPSLECSVQLSEIYLDVELPNVGEGEGVRAL